MSLTWNDLFVKGSIVDLKAGKWRAKVRLEPQDLGIEPTIEVKQALALGSHRLAPFTVFKETNRISRGAVDLVDKYSMPFPMVRGARYVPEQRLPELLEKLADARRQFREAVGDFAANYSHIRTEQLEIIRLALLHAAKTPEAAEVAYRRVAAEYPPEDEIEDLFRLDWQVYAIHGARSDAIKNQVQEESGAVKKVIQGMVKGLRDEMAEKLQDVLAMAARGGKLPEPSKQSALACIERIELLNVLGDRELTNLLEAFRGIVEGTGADDMDKNFEAGIAGIKDQLEQSIKDAQAAAEKALTGVGKRKIGKG